MIDVASHKQLFLYKDLVEDSQDVVRRLHRPRRYEGNPVLTVDRPWESGGNVELWGGSVLYDEDDSMFKMWYRTAPDLEVIEDGHDVPEGGYRACYAVSEDGLHWEKPELGLREFDGSTRNNMLPPSKDGSGYIRRPNLIKDYEEPDPNRRYKMLYMDKIDGRFGLSKGYSADGIHWEMNVGQPHRFDRPVAPNGILFGWDPLREEYVHYHRRSGKVRADVDGRVTGSKEAVMRSSSEDFERWGNTREVLTPEPDDPQSWNRSRSTEIAGVLYADDLYVGTVDTSRMNEVEDLTDDEWVRFKGANFSDHRTELLASKDGVRWDRVMPHWEFMRSGLWGTWDRNHIAASKLIVHNDEILIFYSGGNLPFHAHIPQHPFSQVHNTTVDGQHMGYSIGVARLRLDGFASMESYDEGGTFTTQPITFEGDRLVVNVRAPEADFGAESTPASPYGAFRAELLSDRGEPLAGYAVDDCDAFSGDALRHLVTWRGSHDVGGLADKPVRVRFQLRNAALYSFQFRGEAEQPGPSNPAEPGSRGRA